METVPGEKKYKKNICIKISSTAKLDIGISTTYIKKINDQDRIT